MVAIGEEITLCKAKDKEKIIRFFYEAESEYWHTKIHKKGGSVDENIFDSLNSISEDSTMYEVKCEDKLAAFFIQYEDMDNRLALEGFHIGKGFRKKWFFDKFWKLVRATFGRDFFVGICQSNEPAIRHLKKNGFRIVNRISFDEKIFFIFKS